MRLFDLTLPDGRRLALAEWGDPQDQPVFVFIGGQGRATCHPDESLPQQAGLRLFTVDRPGCGASEWLPGRSLARFAADVAAAADDLDCPRFGLIGVSHGGATAAVCAALLPDRVAALALVSSLAPPEHFVPPLRGTRRSAWLARRAPALLYGLHGMAALMLRIKPAGTVRQVIQGLPEVDQAVYAENPALVETFIRGMQEDYAQGPRGVVHEARLGTLPWGIQPESIRVPALIWHGEQDTTVSSETARWWATRLPDARLTLVPEAGHTLAFTHWAAILAELAALLPGPTTP